MALMLDLHEKILPEEFKFKKYRRVRKVSDCEISKLK